MCIKSYYFCPFPTISSRIDFETVLMLWYYFMTHLFSSPFINMKSTMLQKKKILDMNTMFFSINRLYTSFIASCKFDATYRCVEEQLFCIFIAVIKLDIDTFIFILQHIFISEENFTMKHQTYN
jgi:hypothetical protein